MAGLSARRGITSSRAPLAVEQQEPTNGKIGTTQLPGTMAYTNPATGTESATTEVNFVGNTTGGSWSPVVMAGSESPEATYYFWAMLATEAKQRFYAARGSDGVDPGKWYQMPPEAVEGGTGDLKQYTDAGFTADDAIEYCRAFYDNFNNPKQLPYLRIPGAAEYWSALDIRLSHPAAPGRHAPGGPGGPARLGPGGHDRRPGRRRRDARQLVFLTGWQDDKMTR